MTEVHVYPHFSSSRTIDVHSASFMQFYTSAQLSIPKYFFQVANMEISNKRWPGMEKFSKFLISSRRSVMSMAGSHTDFDEYKSRFVD